MTVYYHKASEVLNSKIYDVNPALYSGLLSTLGKLPLESAIKDPWDPDLIVNYSALKKTTNAKFGKEPQWADGSFSTEPAKAIPFWASWSLELTNNQMKAINADPGGQLSQKVQGELVAQQGAFVNIVDRGIANYLATANPSTNYDNMSDFQGCFSGSNAGTVLDPSDVCSTAGTTTATSVKITGAGQAVDALASGFDVIKDEFHTNVDTSTFQSLCKIGTAENPDPNEYVIYANPQVWAKISTGHLANAAGEREYSQNVGEILRKNYTIVPTYAFDAAYDMASTTVSEYGMAVNPRENFVYQEILPYTIYPWTFFPDKKAPEAGVWKIWAGMRFISYPVAHYINSTWVKGFQDFSNIPYASS